MSTMVDCICEFCSAPFKKKLGELNRTKHNFCSKGCLGKWRATDKFPLRNKIECKCSNCSKTIFRVPFDIERNKELFCGKACRLEHRNKTGFYEGENNPNYKGGDVEVECNYCHKEFIINQSKYNYSKSKQFYCSKECDCNWRRENLKGENSWNWKGGRTKLTILIRNEGEYIEWRKKVFERDYWTCQHCGYRGGKINAHHMKHFIDIIIENNITSSSDATGCKELYDIDNGITLCVECHKIEHSNEKKLYGL